MLGVMDAARRLHGRARGRGADLSTRGDEIVTIGYSAVRRTARRAALPLVAVMAFAAAPAAAQWGTTWVGVAETSGDDVTLLLAGVSLSPAGLGLKPVVGLQTYWLDTEGGSTWSVSPSAGLALRAPTGSLQGRVGYTLREKDNFIPIFGGGESGIFTSAQADYWDGGAFGLQGIASYNWGSQYLWSRARGTVRVMELDFGGGIHVGPEFVYQGEMDDENVGEGDFNYSSTQLGGIVQWHSGNRLIAGFGAGVKNVDEDFPINEEGDDSTWYLKLEFVFH